jgi:hypothetical protein
MAKSDVLENGLLLAIFNGVTMTGLLANAPSPLTHLQVSLHTADPGEAGAQNTSEASYTGYARVAVIRTSAGWVVTGNAVAPAANIVFPTGTAGAVSGPATFWAVGTDATGAGRLLYRAPLDPTIAFGNGVTPIVNAAGSGFTES